MCQLISSEQNLQLEHSSDFLVFQSGFEMKPLSMLSDLYCGEVAIQNRKDQLARFTNSWKMKKIVLASYENMLDFASQITT